MEISDIDITAGSAPILRFQLTTPEDVTGWNTKLIIRERNNEVAIFQANGAISTLIAHADQLGIFDVILTRTITRAWAPKIYDYSFWRTNDGFEDALASGQLRVLRNAVL